MFQGCLMDILRMFQGFSYDLKVNNVIFIQHLLLFFLLLFIVPHFLDLDGWEEEGKYK